MANEWDKEQAEREQAQQQDAPAGAQQSQQPPFAQDGQQSQADRQQSGEQGFSDQETQGNQGSFSGGSETETLTQQDRDQDLQRSDERDSGFIAQHDDYLPEEGQGDLAQEDALTAETDDGMGEAGSEESR